MEIAQQNLRIQRWIALLSVVLFLGKIIAYYITHSLSVLSDAMESTVNVLAGFIGLYSLHVAAKPRDFDHPYGHGKAEFVSAAAEGSLIIASGILIIFQTAASFVQSRPLQVLDIGVIIIASTAVINYVAGYICISVGKRNQSLALQASGKHLQVDTYSTLVVIFGLIIMLWTKFYLLDNLIALGISLFIIYNGYKILRESLAGIMDEVDMDLLNKLVDLFNNNRKENWIDVHNLRVIKYGRLLHVDCHLTVPWYLNINEAHQEIDKLYALVKQEFGDTIEMFIHTDGCRPDSCLICNKAGCDVRQKAFEKTLPWTINILMSDKRHTI